METTPSGPDALIVAMVEDIRDRFGVSGLRELIQVAEVEAVKSEEALSHFKDDLAHVEPFDLPDEMQRSADEA